MKRYLVILFAALGLAVIGAGCAQTSRWPSRSYRRGPTNTVAIALTVNGGDKPTPEQFALVCKAAEPQLAALGWELVTDVNHADRIVRIDFTPNPLAPDTSGRAVYLGMRLNPRGPTALAYAAAAANRGTPGFGFTSLTTSYSNPYYGYDRYDAWNDGSYTYSTPTIARPERSAESSYVSYRRSASTDASDSYSYSRSSWSDSSYYSRPDSGSYSSASSSSSSYSPPSTSSYSAPSSTSCGAWQTPASLGSDQACPVA